MDKIIETYLRKTFKKCSLCVLLYDGDLWREYVYESQCLDNTGNLHKKWDDVGIGKESDWSDDRDVELEKLTNMKKVYVMNL